jgi:hypothetical protein
MVVQQQASRPQTATQALEALSAHMLSVWIPARLAKGIQRLGAGERLARALAVATIVLLPLAINLVLWATGNGAPFPQWAWAALYAAFAAHLLLSSAYVFNKLRDLGPRIDALLPTPERRHEIGAWIGKVSSRGRQLVICSFAAAGSMVLTAVVHDASHSGLSLSLVWLVALGLTTFFASDAVCWVLAFIALVWKLKEVDPLSVSVAAPLHTPAIRELRDFGATLAAVTGIGLFWFAAPLVWAVAYVHSIYQREGSNQAVNFDVLQIASVVAMSAVACIALFAAIAPQLFLSQLVGRQRDRILDELDEDITKDGGPAGLLDPEVAKRVALFNAITATRTSTVGVTSTAKWVLALVTPTIPFVIAALGEGLAL